MTIAVNARGQPSQIDVDRMAALAQGNTMADGYALVRALPQFSHLADWGDLNADAQAWWTSEFEEAHAQA